MKPSWIVATSRAPSTTPSIGPGAAEDVDAADHDGRDHVELEVRGRRRRRRSGSATANMNPPSPASAPLIAKAVITRRPTRDAGEAGGVGVRADRVEVAPPRRPAQDRGAGDARRRARSTRASGRPSGFLAARSRNASGSWNAETVLPVGDLEQEAAVDRERRERGDDRRDRADGDEQPVDEPEHEPDRRPRPARSRRAARRGGGRSVSAET